jgi:hypothetical protein
MNRTLRIWKASDAAEQELIDAAEIKSAEDRALTAQRFKQNQAKSAAKQQQVLYYYSHCDVFAVIHYIWSIRESLAVVSAGTAVL